MTKWQHTRVTSRGSGSAHTDKHTSSCRAPARRVHHILIYSPTHKLTKVKVMQVGAREGGVGMDVLVCASCAQVIELNEAPLQFDRDRRSE